MSGPSQGAPNAGENGSGPSQQQPDTTTSTAAPPQPQEAASKCTHCSKPETSPDPEDNPTLKPCISCKSVVYCSRECKKADTKKHKKVCPELAQEWHRTHQVKMATGSSARRDAGEGHQRGLQKWQFDT